MKKVRVLIVLATCAVLSGCSSPPTRFYVLTPLSGEAPVAGGAGRDAAVGVGPVELPDYLDRAEIVTRTGQNELDLAEFDNWAEPLKDSTSQALAENLATLLPSRRVVTFPWRRAAGVNFQVAVKVIRFDCIDGGRAVLNTRWSLLDGEGKELLTRESRYLERPAGSGYDATVGAMNRALAQFSREVAGEIAARAGNQP